MCGGGIFEKIQKLDDGKRPSSNSMMFDDGRTDWNQNAFKHMVFVHNVMSDLSGSLSLSTQ